MDGKEEALELVEALNKYSSELNQLMSEEIELQAEAYGLKAELKAISEEDADKYEKPVADLVGKMTNLNMRFAAVEAKSNAAIARIEEIIDDYSIVS